MKNLNKYIALVSLMACLVSCSGELELRDKYTVEVDESAMVNNQFTRSGLTLNLVVNDPNYNYIQKVRLTNYFFSVYPLLKSTYNVNAPVNVNMVIDPTYDGLGRTEGSTITLSGKYLTDNPSDLDAVTYQLMHIVQAYNFQTVPTWLTEGLQYYARLKFGQNNSSAGFVLPSWAATQYYTDGGLVTARFLTWLALNYDQGFITRLNSSIRDSGYTDIVWKTTLPSEKSLEDLWILYSKYPGLENRLDQPKDWTVSAKIVVNQDYEGGASSDYGSQRVIDNNINTKFYNGNYNSNFYMQQEFNEPVPIDRYEFVTGNDTPGRDPKNWIFSGSNDKINWDVLDVKQNIDFEGRFMSKVFLLDQERTYKYFRISISANHGDGAFQMSEWRLYNIIDL